MRKLIFLILIASFGLEAQEKQLYSSQEGRYFLVGFMKNEIDEDGNTLHQEIFITSRNDTKVSVIYPDNSVFEYSIPAGESVSVEIDERYEHERFEIEKQGMLIRVTANDPITVYSYSTRSLSSDMVTVFPVNSWGEEYYLTSIGVDYYDDSPASIFSTAPRTGEALIMAAYDGTEITITLNADSRRRKKGDKFTFTLNNGQSYQLGAAEYTTNNAGNVVAVIGSNDLSGTKIESTKPIGVITGHMRTSAPQKVYIASQSKDHICEMLVPTSSWDTRFVTLPFNFKGNNIYKVTAKDDNTNIGVTFDGLLYNYRLDESESLEISTDEIAVWESDKPIQIMQFMARNLESTCEVYFDPALLLVNPVGSFVNNTMFHTPENKIDAGVGNREIERCDVFFTSDVQYEIHQVTILMDKDAAQDIRLDGVYLQNVELAAATNFEPGGERFFFRTVAVQPGAHTLKSDLGKFTIMNYGIGIFDSYAHSTGISIFNENSDLDVNPPQIATRTDCRSFEVDAFDNSEFDLGVFEMITSDENKNFIIEEEYNFANNGILVSGIVDNYEEDASFSATFYDYQNLATTFSYTYSGIKPEVKIESDLGQHLINSIISSTFSIANNSSNTITLKEIIKNSKVNIINPVPENYIMQPGEVLVFDFTINSNGEFGLQYKQIIALFDCDITKSANLRYDITNLSLQLTGYNFGDVYLDDYASAVITVENTGTNNLYLDRLESANNLQFIYDLADFKNTVLEQGESKTVSVTFTPDDRKIYNVPIYAFGTSEIDGDGFTSSDDGLILGKGVAPLFESISHDFGTNWVGDPITESFTFTNRGNIESSFNFENFTNLVSYSQTSQDGIQSTNTSIKPGKSLVFDMTFEPQTPGAYSIDCTFLSNWGSHPEIKFSSIGNAIQEEIDPIDNCLVSDTLFTETSYAKNYSILENTGSESVTITNISIQSIEWFNGTLTNLNPTDPRFQISNLNDYIGNQFAPNSQISLDFLLDNLDAGVYRIILQTDYDNPAPNAENETISLQSRLCLSVEDIPMPNVDLIFGGNIIASPCMSEPFSFQFQNLGNVGITIESLEIFSDGIINTEDLSLPLQLDVNESAFFDGSLLFSLEDDNSVTFSGKFKADKLDSIINFEFVEEVTLIPESIFGPDPKFTQSINDNGNIAFEFEFPYTLPEPIECEITIKADPKLMYLDEDNIDIFQAIDEQSESSFNIGVSHLGSDLILDPNTFTLNINNDRKFYFEVPFLFLLSHYYDTEIEFNVKSNKCFLPLESLIRLELEGTCVYRYRPVEVADDDLDVSIEPFSDQLKLSFETPGDTSVEVWLTDIQGAKVSNFEKKFVINGKHSLYYDLGTLPNGNYFLNFKTNYLNRNRIITKSK